MRRGPRGLATLSGVALLAVVVGVALAVWHAADGFRQGFLVDRQAGRQWGLWFIGMHKAVQRIPSSALPAGWTGDAAGLAALSAARPGRDGVHLSGLRTEGPRVEMHFGVIEIPYDETAVPPVMIRAAFTRLRPLEAVRTDAVRRGAVDAGLADVAEIGPGGVVIGAADMARRRAAIDAALAAATPPLAALREGDFFATSDVAVRRPVHALHRRPQAGHPELSAMHVDLDMDGNDIGAVEEAGTTDAHPVNMEVRLTTTTATVVEIGQDLLVPGAGTIREDLAVARGMEIRSGGVMRMRCTGGGFPSVFVPGRCVAKCLCVGDSPGEDLLSRGAAVVQRFTARDATPGVRGTVAAGTLAVGAGGMEVSQNTAGTDGGETTVLDKDILAHSLEAGSLTVSGCSSGCDFIR